MRKLACTAAAAMLTAASAAHAAPEAPEAKLARALEGRVAGEPVNCISLTRVRGSQVIEGTAIVYEAGGTIYVNRPKSGAESLNRWDALISRTPSTQLCSSDVLQVQHLPSRMMTGLVFLGEFVPYRKAPAGR